MVVRSSTSTVRRQTGIPTKRPSLYDADLEEDCGFKFRRVSKSKGVAVEAKEVEVEATRTVGTASLGKQPSKDRRRRRSSFAAIASRAPPRPSSISVSLSPKMLPTSVSPAEYHKHLMPDLPGPIKMRQLMLWAVQKAGMRHKSGKMHEMIEGTVQALFNNQVTTSWYQRPAAAVDTKNILKRELYEWEQEVEQSDKLITIPSSDPEIRPEYPLATRSQLQELSNWFGTLPSAADQLHWNLSVTASFEAHARSYCESVFHQIRARLFGSEVRPAPLMLLRALTTAPQN